MKERRTFRGVTSICPKCNKEFHPSRSSGGRPSKHCSRSCGSSKPDRYISKKCEGCGKEFVSRLTKKRFCSQVCSNRATSATRKRSKGVVQTKQPPQNLKKVEGSCPNCGNSLKSKKFCSQRCCTDFKQRENIEKWVESENSTVSRVCLRRFLKERDGDKCGICGIVNWCNKPMVFEIEHVDGNPDNTRPENLMLICPNCHSQTQTYKGKNRGNGRFYRRKRYHDGKSY